MSFKKITKQLKSYYNPYKSGTFLKCFVSLGNKCMSGDPGIMFYFCNVVVNKLQKTPPRNIKLFVNKLI